MKYLFSISYIIAVVFLVFYTYYYVKAGDICHTIFGCFVLWCWFYGKNH